MEPPPGHPARPVQGTCRWRPCGRHRHLRRHPRARRGPAPPAPPARRGLPLRGPQAGHRGPDPPGPDHRPVRAGDARHHADRGRPRRWPPLLGGPRHHAPGHLRRHPRRGQCGPHRRRRHRHARTRRGLRHGSVGPGARSRRHARGRGPGRLGRHDLPGGPHQRRRQAAPRRHPRDRPQRPGHSRWMGGLRGHRRRHDLGPVPPARRPLRDRQRLRPGLPPHPGARRRRGAHDLAPRGDDRGPGCHRQTLLR